MAGASPSGEASRRRSIAFVVVSVITILVLGVGFGGVLAGLAIFGSPGEGPGYEFPETHRWHDVQWAANTGFLLVGSLIAMLIKRESRPLLLQFFTAGTVIVAIVTLAFGHPEFLLWPVLAGILVMIYGDWHALVRIPGRDSPLLIAPLVLGIIVAAALLPEALDKLDLQRTNAAGDEHAEHLHWSLGLVLVCQYLLAGVLVASNRRGSRDLAVVSGLSLLFLGLGALVLQDANQVAAVWSGAGALLALAGGVAFLAVGVAGHRAGALGRRSEAVASD